MKVLDKNRLFKKNYIYKLKNKIIFKLMRLNNIIIIDYDIEFVSTFKKITKLINIQL